MCCNLLCCIVLCRAVLISRFLRVCEALTISYLSSPKRSIGGSHRRGPIGGSHGGGSHRGVFVSSSLCRHGHRHFLSWSDAISVEAIHLTAASFLHIFFAVVTAFVMVALIDCAGLVCLVCLVCLGCVCSPEPGAVFSRVAPTAREAGGQRGV